MDAVVRVGVIVVDCRGKGCSIRRVKASEGDGEKHVVLGLSSHEDEVAEGPSVVGPKRSDGTSLAEDGRWSPWTTVRRRAREEEKG